MKVATQVKLKDQNVEIPISSNSVWTMKSSRYGDAMRMIAFSATESTQSEILSTSNTLDLLKNL